MNHTNDPWPEINDRVLTTHGWGIVRGQKPDGRWTLQMEDNPNVFDSFRLTDIRREGLWEYMTRRTGFGVMPWLMFGVIQVILVGLITAGSMTMDNGGIRPIIVASVAEVGLFVAMYLSWKKIIAV